MLACPLSAHAFEKLHHLGGGVGPSILNVHNNGNALGLSAEGHYAYGLSDTFNFVVEGGATLFPMNEPALKCASPCADKRPPMPSLLGQLGVGAIYNLDVLKFVPYGGILVGGYSLSGGRIDGVNLAAGAQVLLGVDWHTSRSVAFGLGIRQHFILTKFADYPSFSQVFLRAEYKWGG